MSTLFLYGAGASAFSGPVAPYRPPVGRGESGLFARLRDSGAHWASQVSPQLASDLVSDFESAFPRVYDEDSSLPVHLMREVATLLLRCAPGRQNHYVTLLRGIRERGIRSVHATLNYDLLLEVSALLAGWSSAQYGTTTRERDVLPVLKPHGSANVVPGLGFKGHGFSVSLPPAASLWDGRFEVVNRTAALAWTLEPEQAMVPAMALYTPSKQPIAGATFIRRQQKLFREAVSEASRIFLIGVSVQEQDAHIWGPLARARAPIFLVDPASANFEDWSARLRRGVSRQIGEDFGSAIPEVLRLVQAAHR